MEIDRETSIYIDCDHLLLLLFALRRTHELIVIIIIHLLTFSLSKLKNGKFPTLCQSPQAFLKKFFHGLSVALRGYFYRYKV